MQLKDYAEAGLVLQDICVIDIHGHLGSPPDPFVPYHDEDDQVKQFTKTMAHVGVDYAAVSMLKGLFTDELEINLDLANLMETYRNILGWATYIPWLHNKSLDIADQCFTVSDRFIGMKIHPQVNRCRIDDARYIPFWEYANDKGLLVLVHTWSHCAYSNPAMLRDIAEKYKDVVVLMGHSGGADPGITTAIDLSNQYENLYLDLTGAFLYSTKSLDYFVARANTDKLLFSSDATYNNLTWEIGNILYSRVSDDIKEKVLGLNAKRLLKSRTKLFTNN